ncbi:MAG: bactofilin family protein [Chitinophagales bacterium]
MFGSKKNAPQEISKTTNRIPAGMANQIMDGTEIEGKITCIGDIRIDGILHGFLVSKAKVIVGPTGFIKGDVICANANIQGKIEGTIKVKELLDLRSSAQMFGEILCGKLAVEAGAIVNGTCKMPEGDLDIDQAHAKASTLKSGNDARDRKQSGQKAAS